MSPPALLNQLPVNTFQWQQAMALVLGILLATWPTQMELLIFTLTWSSPSCCREIKDLSLLSFK